MQYDKRRMAPLEAVIFDLDGTLLNDEFAVSEGLSALHAAHGRGLAINVAELGVKWRKLSRKYYSYYLDRQLSMQEQRRRRIQELFGESRLSVTEQEADAVFSVYYNAYVAAWRAYPEVPQALRALQGIRLAVLTNGEGDQQRAKLVASGIADFFERIFVSSEIGWAKPDPGAFRYVTRELGARESECMFVGDDIEVDVKGAISAGLQAVLMDRKRELTAHVPQIKAVSNLQDFVALIRSRDG